MAMTLTDMSKRVVGGVGQPLGAPDGTLVVESFACGGPQPGTC
jgi:hypothetical protein